MYLIEKAVIRCTFISLGRTNFFSLWDVSARSFGWKTQTILHTYVRQKMTGGGKKKEGHCNQIMSKKKRGF